MPLLRPCLQARGQWRDRCRGRRLSRRRPFLQYWPWWLISGNRKFLIFVLELVKLVVQATLSEKLLVRSHFAHAALMHDQNLIALLNRGKAVGNNDGRSSFHDTVDRLPDLNLRLRVHARR